MKLLLIGHTGTIGKAIYELLRERGHEVVTVARDEGDIQADVTDHAAVAAMYEQAGMVDGVVMAIGSAPFKPLSELTHDDFTAGWNGKALCQIDVVLSGLSHINPGGSFTLTSGILGTTPIAQGAAASTANGAVNAFVMAASATLINDVRINAISPTVITESAAKNEPYFPGFIPIPARTAALTYIRAIEGIETGKVFEVV